MFESVKQVVTDWRNQREYIATVRTLPTQDEIFLPTERLSPRQRLDGIRRVSAIYDQLDTVYRDKLRALREQYKGTKRCFVIGNGPSLNRTDLSVLKDEVTFAVNGFFLKTRDLDWLPTFYVVEDHLVAEDRCEWINAFEGPTKLFPAYLGYCLDEADDTIFFNHQGRVSFPHGFDFSTDAAEITYTGCTVTFTSLQLAAYLGFEEIYLIGVDASYDIPKDAQNSTAYKVGVLDMKSDDPNHFNPDYFGKGFRWHDPQVDQMLGAYEEAKRITDDLGQTIYNATVGGMLEVFPRRDYVDLFDDVKSPEEMDALDAEAEEADAESAADEAFAEQAPRLLVFDITRCGDGTATGEVKANLLAGWPSDRLLQVYNHNGREVGLADGLDPDTGRQASAEEVRRAIAAFRPDLILYRPVPDVPHLHAVAMESIDRYRVPLVTWIMDDWPSRVKNDDPAQYEILDADFCELLDQSAMRLSICDAMSEAFEARYGHSFQAFANGIDPTEWPRPRTRPPGPLTIRHVGSLADNMRAASVLQVAEAVEQLAEEGLPVRFEIKTRAGWANKVGRYFNVFGHTRLITDEMSAAEYREWLRDCDVSLVAYNFDGESLDYVRYSMANKLPECLASGTVVFAFGPRGIATMDYIAESDAAVVVDENDIEAVKSALRDLADDPFLRFDYAERAQSVAFSRHRLANLRQGLREVMLTAASSATRPMPREIMAEVDEKAVLDKLLAGDSRDVVSIAGRDEALGYLQKRAGEAQMPAGVIVGGGHANPLGREDVKALRDAFADAGYAVYLSEWHPQEGARPAAWRQVHEAVHGMPGMLEASGTVRLLAFAGDPGLKAVETAFASQLRFAQERMLYSVAPPKPRPATSTVAPVRTRRTTSAPAVWDDSSAGTRLYDAWYRLTDRVFAFIGWLREAMRIYPAPFMIMGAVLLVPLIAAFIPAFEPYGGVLLLSALLLFLAGLGGLAAFFYGRRMAALPSGFDSALNTVRSKFKR
ncbi:6-hydroxymethylpterin diphosphokinase MptE-like protein [Methyloligella solikamskensis]|uniref:6-hydroxymethylpterin diphosphokinase MptE-like protein n=1 Tax=Methyloligella solikamskensis TaxID=1177756 RepID=A0ABW3JAX5_9HYPH